MKLSFRATMLAAMALALASSALAQRTTGGISGTVKDASGAVLPGVTVSVSGPNIVGTQTALTNEQGFYRFIEPAAGRLPARLQPRRLQDRRRGAACAWRSAARSRRTRRSR